MYCSKTMEARFQHLEETIAKLIEEVKNATAANNMIVQNMVNEINAKLDQELNGEGTQVKTSKKPKPKLSFFKDKLKEDISTYIDILYTQDDLDRVGACDDVMSRKEIHRVSKLADIIYKEIGQDSVRLNKLNEMYEQYKSADIE